MTKNILFVMILSSMFFIKADHEQKEQDPLLLKAVQDKFEEIYNQTPDKSKSKIEEALRNRMSKEERVMFFLGEKNRMNKCSQILRDLYYTLSIFQILDNDSLSDEEKRTILEADSSDLEVAKQTILDLYKEFMNEQKLHKCGIN
jgi:hypothetical protein